MTGVAVGYCWDRVGAPTTEYKENRMKKIYNIRHYTQMIQLAKRVKRAYCITKEDHKKIDWHIENYKSLLELVQDS